MKKNTISLQLFVLALIATISSLSAIAQSNKASVSGFVKDSVAKPIAFATVSLFKKNKLTEPARTTYTNDKGFFKFNNTDTGSYCLLISHGGFSEEQKNIKVTTGKNIELSDLVLVTAGKMLKGITVTSVKPLVEQTDDKIIYNAANDPVAKTETAIDILRKTPFVTVDGDDNVQLNGQSNFKVLLNGRETALFAQNVKEALKGFPGALITKIEVITNPSAKYDGEGIGGLINIITKKKVVGYNGTLSARYSTTKQYNSSLTFSAKKGKAGFTIFFVGAGVNDQTARGRVETVPFTPGFFEKRKQEGLRHFSTFFPSGNAELSFELDSLNTISTYANISGISFSSRFDNTVTTDFASMPSTISYFNSSNRTENPAKTIGADYIRKFKSNKEKEFSIRVNAQFGTNNSYTASEQISPGSDRFIINNSEAVNNEYTIQSDYITPLTKGRKLETGIKAILRRAGSEFESMSKYDPSDVYKPDLQNTDKFNYGQEVYSAYSTYNFKIKKTSFRLGARVEQTQIDGDFISSGAKIKQGYTSLLPNIQVTRQFNAAYTMVLSYGERLLRPFIAYLNPFTDNNDSLDITHGNPGLDAQTIHSISLQNRFQKGATFYGITLTGTYTSNGITRFSNFNQATGVTTTTYGNLGKDIQLAVAGNVNTRFTPNWTITVNTNLRYNRIKNRMNDDQVNSGFSGNGNLNTVYTISKKFSISGSAGVSVPPVGLQVKSTANYFYGTGLVYKLLREKLSVNASINGFMKKERKGQHIITDPLFKTTNTLYQLFRAFALNLSWNFGKLTENVSKKKGITNDDLIGN